VARILSPSSKEADMSTDTAIHVTAVRTVGIPVADQDRALAFYTGTLGLETRLDGEFAPGQRWIEVGPRGGEASLALVKATAEAPAGIDTRIRLTTDDAAAAHAGLVASGVDADAEIIPFPVPMFTFRDPDGNRLVVVEVPNAG
jgi:catechol 2,3-dioxygenase-like lactoylglutathione lyase family enzyme